MREQYLLVYVGVLTCKAAWLVAVACFCEEKMGTFGRCFWEVGKEYFSGKGRREIII